MTPSLNQCVSSVIGHPFVLILDQNESASATREREYFSAPIESKVRVRRIKLVRALTGCGSPDLLVPFVVRDCGHFIFSKMSSEFVSWNPRFERDNTCSACLTPIGLLMKEVVVAAA